MEKTMTTNGAISYKSTNDPFVDFNFSISSLRNEIPERIVQRFDFLIKEDPILAFKYLLFIRNPRGGLGEKKIYREIIKKIIIDEILYRTEVAYQTNLFWESDLKNFFRKIFICTAQYGSWKDVMIIIKDSIMEIETSFLKSSCRTKLLISQNFTNAMIDTIAEMFLDCISHLSMENSKAEDLADIWFALPKYMPTENSSVSNKILARKIAKALKISPKEYRKRLSAVRNKIIIVERDMCANKWDQIKYSAVPSKANLLYAKSFKKHDYDRREEYLDNVSKGKEHINSSLAFPHEIYNKIKISYYFNEDNTPYELMWQDLPSFSDEETIVVVDGSGSMNVTIACSSITIRDIARSLGIYYAEHCTGEFHNKFIEFSSRPQLIELPKGTLTEKKKFIEQFTNCSNTDIDKVMDVLLMAAIQYKAKKIPNVLIISDMQFDKIKRNVDNDTLFENIQERYRFFEYDLPKITFWNLNQHRGDTIPLTENKNGLTLVSGYSPFICNMVIHGNNPHDTIVKACEKYNDDIAYNAMIQFKKCHHVEELLSESE